MGKPSKQCLDRLRKEFKRIQKDPVENILAAPLESNLLEWHYCLKGSPDTPYEGGYYHGKVVFPPDYPYKPPAIYMLTPNGRFKVCTRLCLSISDFHPESWSCLWSVSSILTGVLSFMNESAITYGSITTSEYERRVFSAQSLAFNVRDATFVECFPELVELYEATKEERESRIPLLTPDSRVAVSDILIFGGILAVVSIAVYYIVG